MAYIFTIQELHAYDLDDYYISQRYPHGWLWVHLQTKNKLFIVNDVLQKLGYHIRTKPETQAICISQRPNYRRRRYTQTISKSDNDLNWRHYENKESTSAPETYTLLSYKQSHFQE